MNAGTKETETNKTAREHIYDVQEREAEAGFYQLCQQEEMWLFLFFFFQVANVRSAAYVADGFFTTHHL